MPPDLTLCLTLISSNYPCLEHFFTVPKVFKPLKFYCICMDLADVHVVWLLYRQLFPTDLVWGYRNWALLTISFSYFEIFFRNVETITWPTTFIQILLLVWFYGNLKENLGKILKTFLSLAILAIRLKVCIIFLYIQKYILYDPCSRRSVAVAILISHWLTRQNFKTGSFHYLRAAMLFLFSQNGSVWTSCCSHGWTLKLSLQGGEPTSRRRANNG